MKKIKIILIIIGLILLIINIKINNSFIGLITFLTFFPKFNDYLIGNIGEILLLVGLLIKGNNNKTEGFVSIIFGIMFLIIPIIMSELGFWTFIVFMFFELEVFFGIILIYKGIRILNKKD